jgi:hypothetical protein
MQVRARKLVSTLAVSAALLLALPAAAFAAYGSIAVGTSGAGKSWGYSTKHAAIHKARRECEKVSPNCTFALWVSGSKCAATYYANSKHKKVYYAFANSKSGAKRKVRDAHPGAIYITSVCASHS